MSSLFGDNDEMMNLYPSDEQAEALIRGEIPQDADLAEVGDLVNSLRSLGDHPITDDLAERHVAMIVSEVEVSPGAALGGARPPVTPLARRKVVLSSLLSSMLVKVLAASVAVAAVGTGVGIAADASAPGEALYGIDRAMEQVGIADGGATERVEEARSLIEVDLPEAVASAGKAAEASGDAEAAAALADAADGIRNLEEGQSDAIRQQVAQLLDLISGQLADGGVVGDDVASAASAIRDAIVLPEQAPVEAPPVDVPSEGGQPGDVPTEDSQSDDVPPEEAETGDTIPEDAPPVSTPTSPPTPPTTRP